MKHFSGDSGQSWPLGYSSSWLDLGIVSEQDIERDFLASQHSEDPHAEHYRWRAFTRFMQANASSLPASVARALYALGAADPDAALGGSMMSEVLRHPDCPIELLSEAANSDQSHLRKLAQGRLAEPIDDSPK